jgi:hypothetical protein
MSKRLTYTPEQTQSRMDGRYFKRDVVALADGRCEATA